MVHLKRSTVVSVTVGSLLLFGSDIGLASAAGNHALVHAAKKSSSKRSSIHSNTLGKPNHLLSGKPSNSLTSVVEVTVDTSTIEETHTVSVPVLHAESETVEVETHTAEIETETVHDESKTVTAETETAHSEDHNQGTPSNQSHDEGDSHHPVANLNSSSLRLENSKSKSKD